MQGNVFEIVLKLQILLTISSGIAYKFYDRNIPNSYSFHAQHNSTFVIREYLLQEVEPRTKIVCPKGFFIGEVSHEYAK